MKHLKFIVPVLSLLLLSCGQLRFKDFTKRKYCDLKRGKHHVNTDNKDEQQLAHYEQYVAPVHPEEIDITEPDSVQTEGVPNNLSLEKEVSIDIEDIDVLAVQKTKKPKKKSTFFKSKPEKKSTELADFNGYFKATIIFLGMALVCFGLGLLLGVPAIFGASALLFFISWFTSIVAVRKAKKVEGEERFTRTFKVRTILMKFMMVSPLIFFILLVLFFGYLEG